MRRQRIDARSVTAGSVVAFLAAAREHEERALPALVERLKELRRKDVEDFATCVSGLLLSLVRQVGELEGGPDATDLLAFLGLELAQLGWSEDPAAFLATVYADRL